MIAVHGIPAAAEVIIVAVGSQKIVNVIVKAFKRDEGTVLVAFRRVVEDHVQDHFDAIFMKRLHQLLELHSFPVVLHRRGIAGVGREKSHRVVAPVIDQFPPVHLPAAAELVKLEDRHQFNGVDPQILQVGDLLLDPPKSSLRLHIPGHLGKASHMHFIDDQLLHGDLGLTLRAPVEIVAHHPGPVALLTHLPAPHTLAGDRPGIRIQKYMFPVKQQPLPGIPGTVQPVGILKLLHIQAKHDHRIHVPDPVVLRERQHRVWLRLLPVVEKKFTGCGPLGLDREVHPFRNRRGSKKHIEARPHIKAVHPVQRLHVLDLRSKQTGSGKFIRHSRLPFRIIFRILPLLLPV